MTFWAKESSMLLFLIEKTCTLLLFTEEEDVDGCMREEIEAPWGMAGVEVAADMMGGGTESLHCSGAPGRTGARTVT